MLQIALQYTLPKLKQEVDEVKDLPLFIGLVACIQKYVFNKNPKPTPADKNNDNFSSKKPFETNFPRIRDIVFVFIFGFSCAGYIVGITKYSTYKNKRKNNYGYNFIHNVMFFSKLNKIFDFCLTYGRY